MSGVSVTASPSPDVARRAVRILLIDDDPQARQLVEISLADAPFEPQVDVASTVAEGRRRISKDSHDLYLVDQRLPDGTGLDLIRAAKADGATRPFILLTGYGSGELDEAALREGAADYVEKHLLSSHLERSIRYALRNWEAARALQEREEQLRHAQKMEAIGRLAGGIAHDFNNLLTAIIGYTDMIAERLEASNDATRRDLREIRKAADRAASLTRQLLALSRKQFITPRVLDINETISDLLDMLTRVIGEHIHLLTRLDPAIGPVRADPAQLEQVVMNLAINARDAMPDGGRLTISTSPAQLPPEARRVATHPLSDGSYVLITFTDTGSGIDPDTLARVFEPFFTTKPKGRGTGLGLATVAAIVEQSGGVVTIHSEVGKGTTLQIYLPETSQPADEHGSADAVIDPPQHYGSECILLVEDHPAIRELAARALRRRGYIVYDEGSGDDALQWALASDVTPDLLVTDVVMPGMSGPALAAQLRQRNPALRVLYMSGYSEDGQTFLEGTGVALLQKPFTQADLVDHVRRALERVPPSP